MSQSSSSSQGHQRGHHSRASPSSASSSSSRHRHRHHPLQDLHQVIHNDASAPIYVTLSFEEDAKTSGSKVAADSTSSTSKDTDLGDGADGNGSRKKRRTRVDHDDDTSSSKGKDTSGKYRLGTRFILHSSTDKAGKYWKVRVYGTLLLSENGQEDQGGGGGEGVAVALWKGYMDLKSLGEPSA